MAELTVSRVTDMLLYGSQPALACGVNWTLVYWVPSYSHLWFKKQAHKSRAEMMGTLENLKKQVRNARRAGRDYKLSYSQHLEVACRLVFNVRSMNHYLSKPDDYTWFASEPISDVLARIQTVAPMLHGRRNEFSQRPAAYEVYDTWEQAAEILLYSIGARSEEPFADIVLGASDVSSLPVPAFMGPDGTLSNVLDDDRLPQQVKLRMVISSWLSRQYGGDGSLLLGLWSRMKAVAIDYGMPLDVADYYRSICREVHNHDWSVEAHVAIGVLDIPIERGSFFIRHTTPESVREAIDSIWGTEEPEE